MTEPTFKLEEEFNDDIFEYFQTPQKIGFTIYGLSKCVRCDIVKEEINELFEDTLYINCDEYIKKDKDRFKKLIFPYMDREFYDYGKNTVNFPIVFSSGKYISNFSIDK